MTQSGSRTAKPEEQSHPLRLSPFDVLMLLDERPGYPMCFFIETQLSGNFLSHRFRDAVRVAVEQHPRLRSYAQYNEQGWQWVLSDELPQVIELEQMANQDLQASAFRPFDIRREPGIRFIVTPEGEQQWSIILQVHHSVCDGLAALEFLGDIWSLYHGNAPPPFRPKVEPKSNQLRTAKDSNEHVQVDHQHLRETLSFATFRPSCVASSKAASLPSEKEPDSNRRPFQSFTLPPIRVQRLRQYASQSGATTNDIIVAASILAIHEWNTRQSKPKNRIRITMPVNLRPPRSRQPASNQIGYAFLDRYPNQLQEPHETMKSIAEASRWIQHSGAAGMFLIALGFFLNRTWLLRLITRLPACFSTAVVSNIGNVQGRMRANVPKEDGRNTPGGLTITNMRGVPPVRPGTVLSVGITNYCNQLTITTMTDSRQLSPDDRAELTMLIQSQIERIAPQTEPGQNIQAPPLPKSTTLTAD